MAYVNPLDTGPSFTQTEPPIPPLEPLNILPSPNGSVLSEGTMQSPNYVSGSTGWKVSADGSAEFRNITTNNSKLLKNFVAGEYITKGDAVFSGPSTTIDLLTSTNDHGATFNVGNVDARMRLAQNSTETTDNYINTIKIYVKKFNSPTDSLVCAVQTDDVATGTHPSGTDLASGSVTGASLTGAYALTTFTLNTAIKLVANRRYWFVLRRSIETPDASNSYQIATNTGNTNTYNNGAVWEWVQSGDSWGILSGDFDFKLSLVTTGGRVYKTSASTAGQYESFIGIADGSGIPSGDVDINVAGISEISSLTLGSQYYISNTRGALSTSAGSNTRKAGIAVSTTELLITNLW